MGQGIKKAEHGCHPENGTQKNGFLRLYQDRTAPQADKQKKQRQGDQTSEKNKFGQGQRLANHLNKGGHGGKTGRSEKHVYNAHGRKPD